jgi:hypothetical protein
MRPDYIDRDRKANVWMATIAPPPTAPSYPVTRALRQAFDVTDAIPDEWDQMLARLR